MGMMVDRCDMMPPSPASTPLSCSPPLSLLPPPPLVLPSRFQFPPPTVIVEDEEPNGSIEENRIYNTIESIDRYRKGIDIYNGVDVLSKEAGRPPIGIRSINSSIIRINTKNGNDIERNRDQQREENIRIEQEWEAGEGSDEKVNVRDIEEARRVSESVEEEMRNRVIYGCEEFVPRNAVKRNRKKWFN